MPTAQQQRAIEKQHTQQQSAYKAHSNALNAWRLATAAAANDALQHRIRCSELRQQVLAAKQAALDVGCTIR
jgi:hypothetical protein